MGYQEAFRVRLANVFTEILVVAPKVLKYVVFVLDLVGEVNKKRDTVYLYSQKS